jgi:two-component system, OmpR family, KDP operon response regulator KdpE
MSETAAPKIEVLLVDDEIQIRRLLRVCLEGNGYRVREAVTGQDAITQAAQNPPDIILLDLGLPDMDGLTVIKRLREWTRVPIVVLSVRDRDDDKVSALDHGADDFVTKPFSSPELLARLRVALRHTTPATESPVFRSGDLEMDLNARIVKHKGQEVKLTATEYSILRLFVQHAGKVLTHRQILQDVWGPGHLEQTHYLRVYIGHLREKLESEPSEPRLITTEPGVGYRLLLEPAPKTAAVP